MRIDRGEVLRSDNRVEPESAGNPHGLPLLLVAPDAAETDAEAAIESIESPGTSTDAAKVLGGTELIKRLVSIDSTESSSAWTLVCCFKLSLRLSIEQHGKKIGRVSD